MSKGITPVIAIVLLILITVGAVGVIYGMTTGIMNQGTSTDKLDSFVNTKLSIISAAEQSDGINLYIKNIGDEPFNASRLSLKVGKGKPVAVSPYGENVVGMESVKTLADWRMNRTNSIDGDPQTLNDFSGNSVSGRLGETTGSDSSDPTWKTNDCRTGNSCLDFDGDDDYIELQHTSTSPNRTKMAWINLDNKTGKGDGRMGIISHTTWNDGDIHFHIEGEEFGISMPPSYTPKDPVRTDEWMHVAASYNTENGRVRTFIDGKQVNSIDTKDGLTIQPDDWIGTEMTLSSWDRYLNGTVDGARIYNQPLTEEQIRFEMYGKNECFKESKIIEPGETYSCGTGIAVPPQGEQITFEISSKGKSWTYTCRGSRDGSSC